MSVLIVFFVFLSAWFILPELILNTFRVDIAGWVGDILFSRFPEIKEKWKFVEEEKVKRVLGFSLLCFVSIIFAIILPPLVFVAPSLSFLLLTYLNIVSKKEVERFKKEFSVFVELLAVSLKGGVDILSSIEAAGEVLTGRGKKEVDTLLVNTREKGFYESLKEFVERNNIEEVRFFYERIIHSKKTGSSLSSALIGIADEMRRRMLEESEKRVNTLPQRIILPMLLLFIATLMYLTGPVIIGARKEVMFP